MKSRILDSARTLFLEEGVDGISMRRIADQVGVTATAIYRHYKDKDDLLNAITNEGFDVLERYLVQARDGARAGERVPALLDAYVRFALDQPRHYEFMFVLARKNVRRYPDDFAHRRSATFNLLLEEVRAGIERGDFRSDDALETSLGVWALLHGLISLQLAGRFGADGAAFRALCARSLDRHIAGIRA